MRSGGDKRQPMTDCFLLPINESLRISKRNVYTRFPYPIIGYFCVCNRAFGKDRP